MTDRHAPVIRELQRLGPEAWSPPPAPPLDLDGALSARRLPTARRHAGGIVLRPAAAFAAAAALLLGGGAAGALVRGGDGPAAPAPQTAAGVILRPLDAGAPATERVRLTLPRGPGGDVDLVGRGLPPTPEGRFYEVWLMTDGRHLASVATFRVGPDGRARFRFRLGVDPRRYRYVDVSLETDDGDPGHGARSVLRSAPL